MNQMQELNEILSSMPPEDKAKSQECAEKIMKLITEYGTNGVIALTVVGISMQTAIED